MMSEDKELDGRPGASAPSGSQASPGAASASPPSVSIPDAWRPIEYDEGYPVDEDFGWFGQTTPPFDFHRAAHWLLAELPRASEFMVCAYCNITSAVDDFDDPVKLIEFSTGGWSGCESIIGLIERRFDLRHFMLSWRRGGHYVFEIPAHFLERVSDNDEGTASAAGARSVETNEDSARSEGRQSGGEAATPTPSPDTQGPDQ